MKNTRIERIVNKYKKNKNYDVVQLKNISTSINVMAEYIRKKYADKPVEEMREELYEEIIVLNEAYANVANPRGLFFQSMAGRVIAKDREFIEEECKKLDNKSNLEEIIIYDMDLKENQRKFLHQIYVIVKTVESTEGYNEHIKKLKTDPQYKKFYSKKYNISIKEIDKEIDLCTGTTPQKVKKRIEDILLGIENDLRNMYIENLEFLGEFFEEFNLLEKYTNRHLFKMQQIGLEPLKFEYSTDNYDIDQIGAKELFNRKILNNLDTNRLMMLSMFYQNRFAKEISTLGEAIFAIDSLDLWDDIKKGKKIELSSQTLSAIKDKANCVEDIVLEVYMNKLEKEGFSEEEIEEGKKLIDFNEGFSKVAKQEGRQYQELFDKKLPNNENNLINDIYSYSQILAVKENIYKLRESQFSTLLYTLINSKNVNNFGIIKKELVNGKLKDTSKGQYVLIGVDFEGLNMPIRFHVNRKNLIESLKAYQSNAIIQEYEGAFDFIHRNDVITTNLLMPMPKRHKVFINEKYSQTQGKDKLISHLRYLKDISTDKFPKHLKKQVKDKKGKDMLKRVKKYMDLETGEEFVLENNKLVLNKEGEDISIE